MLFIANKLINTALSKILVSFPSSSSSFPGLIFIIKNFLSQPLIAPTFQLPTHNQIWGKPAQ